MNLSGNSFQYMRASDQYASPHLRLSVGAQPQGSSYTETTNITVKNGPSGFWGFMSGLAGGLGLGGGWGGSIFGGGSVFGGGFNTCSIFGGMPWGNNMLGLNNMYTTNLFGNLFGGNMFGTGLFSGGLGTGGLLSSNTTVTPQGTSAQYQLANLTKLFPKYTIVLDDNGEFTTLKDGKPVRGTYDQILNELGDGSDAAKASEHKSTASSSSSAASSSSSSSSASSSSSSSSASSSGSSSSAAASGGSTSSSSNPKKT